MSEFQRYLDEIMRTGKTETTVLITKMMILEYLHKKGLKVKTSFYIDENNTSHYVLEVSDSLGIRKDFDMKNRIYISGAITGTTDYMERFAAAEEKLTAEGYSVVNPAKVNAMMPEGMTWDDYMKMSFAMLDLCDSIYMLKGWENSKGATLENIRAFAADYKIIEER